MHSILFQSLEQIQGKEKRSKLLHVDSDLYKALKKVRSAIDERYPVAPDRMDLHIQLCRDQKTLVQNTAELQGKTVDLADPASWGFINSAFVLWTPNVPEYGKTHITVAFFGEHPKPELYVLLQLISQSLI